MYFAGAGRGCGSRCGTGNWTRLTCKHSCGVLTRAVFLRSEPIVRRLVLVREKRTGMKRSLLFAGGDRFKTNQTKHTRDHANQILDIVQKQKLQMVEKEPRKPIQARARPGKSQTRHRSNTKSEMLGKRSRTNHCVRSSTDTLRPREHYMP